jgi:hypothetical protein
MRMQRYEKNENAQEERLRWNHFFNLALTWNFFAYSFPTKKIPSQNAFVPISNAVIRTAESFTPSFMKGMMKIIPQKTQVKTIKLIPRIRCTLLFTGLEVSRTKVCKFGARLTVQDTWFTVRFPY